ncbi:ABC transporter permease [Salinibacterium soli]|uniref:ABC transporter permease subunit n=1 Tax=Antiquaquibacter soli TaxID=3064523 RepID=A0ABT9BLD7_9MICO|nr:ABC transporter permease subunit [Protaetiibacter sp. WY-16]MDO7881257.1 ABC transporter permease subunit [Protaetiibacter sp. WY-16]
MTRSLNRTHSPAPSRATRWIILGAVGLLFALPLVSMVEFTLRGGLEGGYTIDRWVTVFTGQLGPEFRQLWLAIGNSLLLAAVTVAIMLVLLVPTMILVQLSFPRLRHGLEFICLLPITIPAIVLVVGLAPVYSVVSRMFGSGVWTLAFAYGVLVLPYAYRAIQANLDSIDVKTLSEAARSLGAGWGTVLFRVLIPNLRRGILAASFIAVAVVLGEFTVASLLNRVNLQTALLIVNKADPYIAVIFALLSLLFAFVLLVVIGRVGSVSRKVRS